VRGWFCGQHIYKKELANIGKKLKILRARVAGLEVRKKS